ncbi:acyltransferase domain-containing protein [Streptomonospora wellingtoniae]|uniref:Acyltransferase domain-containing protein n=1 Tax=Streptomonospora wellingtoniae TaxID=3075544 RepID=A0ABU2KX16_9ACTN|nr:acyltransferase domain-containing protein [Streptomonospora sp. DSM 45055]MDT0303792.1 acyltransferase domain-containing protein [Streptomonospora sp. DSM 45055]
MNADAEEAGRRLGLDERAQAWLDEAAAVEAPGGGPEVAPPSRAREALAPLGPARADEDAIAALWPDGSWPEELMWVVGRMYARLAGDLAEDRPQWRDWPVLVHSADARVRCAMPVALTAAVPLVLAEHARWGVPASVSAATLADVGRHLAQTRAMFGRVGLETAAWAALHFRCGLYELGRLQYEPNRVRTDAAVRWYAPQETLEPELARGAPVLRLHIPADGPLAPERVDASLARARGFFADCFGADYPIASCSSWLLDPQLAAYLPEASNILAFQRRFTLVEEDAPGDEDVFRFVFGMPAVDVDRAPRRSRLERAAVEHLRAGRHWRVRTGWLRL